MSYKECMDLIERAMEKGALSDKDLTAIDKRIQGLMKDLQANNDGQDVQQALMKALSEDAERAQIQAILAKRNTIKNQIARTQELAKLRANFSHDYAEGLQGLAGGSVTAAKGGKDSTVARIAAQMGYYAQGLISELEAAGTHRILAAGEFDEPLAHALWEFSKAQPDMTALAKAPGMNQVVMDGAKIIGKWQEKTRLDRNDAGAWIGKLEGYIAGRTHDMAQIKQAGLEKWSQWMGDHMDWDKTMPDLEIADRGKELARMYSDFVVGEHLKFQEGPREALPPGFANIGKKASRERVLFLKDAASEFEYHRLYGGGDSLMSNILGDMDRAGREVAIMRKLGPNAKATFDDIYDSLQKELREKNDEPAREKLKASKAWIDNYLWPQITGEARIPVDIGFSHASGAVRNVFTMSKLALAPITQLMDNVGIAMAHKNLGGTMFEGMGQALSAWGDMARPYMKDDAEMMGYMGMMLDHMRGFHSSPYETGMDTTGLIAKSTQRMMKWNGMNRIRDKEAITFMGLTGNRLASRADHALADLEPGLRQILGEYGIGEKEWNVVRGMEKQTWRGNEVFTPEGVRQLAPDKFDALAQGEGDYAREAARTELESKLRTFFTDQTNTAVLNRDDMTSALLLRGTRPGTKEGEALRHVMLFKSFTANFMRRVLGREIYGHGLEKEPLYKQLFNIVRDGKTDSMSGLANVIAWSTAMGYGVYALKSLAKGRLPQWPTDSKEALSVTGTAFAQGGGLGVYGDFLFWQGKETMGKGNLESYLGPTLGTAEDIWNLAHSDDKTKQNIKNAQAAKIAFSVVPNLFYTKAAFDYLITYRTMEWLNPGSVARMQQNIKKDQGEDFYVQPTGK